MKSTLLNMILSLFGITLVASAGVAGIYGLTVEPIAAAEQALIEESLAMVLPEFDNNEKSSVEVDYFPIDIYTASKDGKVVGYAVQSITKRGYSGIIKVMVGIGPDMKLLDVSVLSHKETPGLGSKMTEADNPLIKGVKGQDYTSATPQVKKDGGDIDALTGATISSRAYLDAVKRAYTALKEKGVGNE
ncbi:MAG: RnfABCDGE type electron transport complex subunit G [Rikenellaceae bacterium]